MFVSSIGAAPARQRAGLSSKVLLQAGDAPHAPHAALAVTWVDVAPRGRQRLHSHARSRST